MNQKEMLKHIQKYKRTRSCIKKSERTLEYIKDVLPVFENEDKKFLKKKIVDGELVLLVGAGVTRALVGNWNELLNEISIMQVCAAMDKSKPACSLNELRTYVENCVMDHALLPPGTNPLEQGEYLMYDRDDYTAYEREMDLPDNPIEMHWREKYFAAQTLTAIERLEKRHLNGEVLCDYYAKWVNSGGACISGPNLGTLAAVVELCIKGNIREIITYNFDTILDRLLASSGTWKLYKREAYQKRVEIYGIDDWVNPDENIKGQTIKIYHVHGIVSSERDDTCPIIFSENSYQEFQQGMLNWSNVRLAEAIGKNRVLCVGFSGTDTSFRSLCHQLKAQRRAAIFGNEKPDGNHIYLALTCEDIIRRFIPDPNWAEQNRINAFYGSDFDKNKEYAKRCLSAYFNSVKAYYDHQLGVVPLWFKDFDKLAAGIKSILA